MTIRVRDENINTQDFWDLAWKLEPAWRHGLGLEPDRWTVLTAPLQPGMTILDIGGGRGEFLDWIGTDHHRTLFDHSRYAINHATTQGWCEQGIVGDCTQPPPPMGRTRDHRCRLHDHRDHRDEREARCLNVAPCCFLRSYASARRASHSTVG